MTHLITKGVHIISLKILAFIVCTHGAGSWGQFKHCLSFFPKLIKHFKTRSDCLQTIDYIFKILTVMFRTL